MPWLGGRAKEKGKNAGQFSINTFSSSCKSSHFQLPWGKNHETNQVVLSLQKNEKKTETETVERPRGENMQEKELQKKVVEVPQSPNTYMWSRGVHKFSSQLKVT